MPPKQKPIDTSTDDELTIDHVFTGADHDDDLDEDLSAADRGDDPNAEQLAAADEDELEAAPSADEADVAEDDTAESKDEKVDDTEEADEVVLEADDEAEDGDEADPKISPYVSKDRFEAVNERMKLAEEALARRDAAVAEAPVEVPAFDYDMKELEYMELVTDGEFEKAKTIRQEIRSAERAEFAATSADAQTTAQQVTDTLKFNDKVDALSVEFDTFNVEHESYDQVMVDDVIDRRDLFVNRGMTMADALDKAAHEVAKLYDIPSNLQEAGATPTPKPKPPAKKADVAKKVAQASKQPSKMTEGSDGGELEKTALNMNDAEFEALPESTKARMRGDIV